uniref:Putative transcription factor TFIIB zinc-binding motif n=1 Tax=viral metagenome TaxID=1070528 RepID=A0A6H1ZB10_9ZZZZ
MQMIFCKRCESEYFLQSQVIYEDNTGRKYIYCDYCGEVIYLD